MALVHWSFVLLVRCIRALYPGHIRSQRRRPICRVQPARRRAVRVSIERGACCIVMEGRVMDSQTTNKQLTITPTDSIWHTSTHQQSPPPQQQPQHHHWHMTTEPSFITRPRPTGWTKPGIVNLPATMRPSKPAKPTKKPIVYERPPTPLPTTTTSTTTTTTTMMQTRPKPKPKPIPTRPQVCKYASSSLCLLATIPHPVPHALCVCDALMSKAKQTSDEVIYSSIRLGFSAALML